MFKLIRHVFLLDLCLSLTLCCQLMTPTSQKTTALLTRHPLVLNIAPLNGTLIRIEDWISKIAEFQKKK